MFGYLICIDSYRGNNKIIDCTLVSKKILRILTLFYKNQQYHYQKSKAIQ